MKRYPQPKRNDRLANAAVQARADKAPKDTLETLFALPTVDPKRS